MTRFDRLVARLAPSRGVLAVLGVLVFVLGGVRQPFLGLVALALFAAGLVLRTRAQAVRDWSPDVNGENPYQILGVPAGADTPAVRRAFRALELRYHPDAVPPDRRAEATAVFVRINQAYELLADADKRFAYDALVEANDGAIPPFAEAYARLKDEDKHPIYAAFDARPPEPAEPAPGGEGTAGGGAAGTVGWSRRCPEAHVRPDDESASNSAGIGGDDPGGVPAEVEIPESIREAMGLPPTPDPGRPSGETRPPD